MVATLTRERSVRSVSENNDRTMAMKTKSVLSQGTKVFCFTSFAVVVRIFCGLARLGNNRESISSFLRNRKTSDDPFREISWWISTFPGMYSVPRRRVPFAEDSLGFAKHVGNEKTSGKRGARVVMNKTRSITDKISFLARNLSPRKLNRGRVRWRTPISDVQLICARLRPSCCIKRAEYSLKTTKPLPKKTTKPLPKKNNQTTA